MKQLLFVISFCGVSLFSFSQGTPSVSAYREDFNFFWNTIDQEYCYFNKKQTDWQRVKEKYEGVFDTVSNRGNFISALEKVLNELYDHHAIINTNTDHSFRLVPSGTDIWAEYHNGKALITEVRKGFGAEACGIKAGMQVKAVNGVDIEDAIRLQLPVGTRLADEEVKSFVLRLLLAGRHDEKRTISIRSGVHSKDYYPDQPASLLEHIGYTALVESKIMGGVGYIRINDCLYDNSLIGKFDSVMQRMSQTKGLILDLRETPSGGNTTVARAIMGWFIAQEKFYQKHEYYAEEKETGIKRSWEEIVSPRKGKYYDKPLVILCNHWTGSVSEGLTIGFDALKRPNTTIIGTPMAALNGAVYSFEMPNTKIHFGIPAERLYHINGTPREAFMPGILIDVTKQTDAGKDMFLDRAVSLLKK